MKKTRKSLSRAVPPEMLETELIIHFGPGIPAGIAPDPDEPVVPDDEDLAWLRKLVDRWSAVRGCSRLFGGSSTPVDRLEEDIASEVSCWDGRRLVSLDWWNGPGLSSSWSVEAIDFGEASRLYVEWREFYGRCLLAYSDDPDAERADRQFLRVLFAENGSEFDTVVMYGEPSAASGGDSVSDELLVEVLASGFGQGEWQGASPRNPAAAARAIVKRGRRKGEGQT